MEIEAIADPTGFSELSKADRIRYVEKLWDRTVEDAHDMPVIESHLKLAERRLAEHRANPGSARTARELVDQLGGKMR